MAEQRYGALLTIASVLRVLAWIVAIGCGLGLVIVVIWGVVEPASEVFIVALMLLLYGVFGFIYMYACSEGILVILDIETNTRTTNALLTRLAQTSLAPKTGES